jgi:hypothetical protein
MGGRDTSQRQPAPTSGGLGWAGLSFFKEKSSFLTVQLSLKFGFGHQTSKPVIFSHPNTKIVQIWPLGCFDRWF